jgi:hypothetical protein
VALGQIDSGEGQVVPRKGSHFFVEMGVDWGFFKHGLL